MKRVGSPMQSSSGRRVILPPATTFLHINRALDIFGAIIVAWNEKETLYWSMNLKSAKKYWKLLKVSHLLFKAYIIWPYFSFVDELFVVFWFDDNSLALTTCPSAVISPVLSVLIVKVPSYSGLIASRPWGSRVPLYWTHPFYLHWSVLNFPSSCGLMITHWELLFPLQLNPRFYLYQSINFPCFPGLMASPWDLWIPLQWLSLNVLHWSED